MKEPLHLSMFLPRIPEVELIALAGLDHLARHLGIAEDKIGEARIVVTEALINAFEHAGADAGRVRVEFSISPDELTVFVQDFGQGFDATTLPERQRGTDSKIPEKRGWGITLMRSLSDEFRIRSGEQGTTITITKRMS